VHAHSAAEILRPGAVPDHRELPGVLRDPEWSVWLVLWIRVLVDAAARMTTAAAPATGHGAIRASAAV
jgi:hypothetical protein